MTKDTANTTIINMKKVQGFTLIEVLLVVALIGIIAAIGLPAFSEISANNRLMTSANNFIGSFHRARSEALKRSTEITLLACKPDCGTTGTASWENGWQIFIDTDGDDAYTAGTDELLNAVDDLPPSMTASQNGTTPINTIYTYNAQGRLIINQNNEIKLCDARTGETGRLITLTLMGRLNTDYEPCP